jgi:membrane protein
MAQRGFFTGFLLPVAAAMAISATFGSRQQPAGQRAEGEGGQSSRHGLTPDRRNQRPTGPVDYHRARQNGHGRDADQPHEIPARGWWDILMRVRSEMAKDHLSVLAAGIGFYSLLAIFPTLAAAVSIYGMVLDPQDVQNQIGMVLGVVPEQARAIITDQLSAITSAPRQKLGISAIVALLFALWTSSAAVQTLMTGLNVVYDEPERRGFLAFYATALALTLGGIVFGLVALSLVAAVPAIVGFLGLPPKVETAILLLRWPLLAIAVMVALAVLYRFAPSREKPRWTWVSWGAVLATLLWLAGSILFSFYVSNFASYNETYGTLGAVVILLMWFYLSGYVVLIGGELNAEMEHQTAKDTTEKRGAPLGRRDARMADTVGAPA